MKPHRRRFLNLSVGAFAFAAAPRCAFSAEAFPARPIKMVVPFAPGGVGDILMRVAGQTLQERLGQPFIVENRPGAGGNLGTELVSKAPGDGYTLLAIGAVNAINASVYDKLNFDFIRDVAPVAGVIRGPLFMVVNPSVPAQTVPEFIAHAKANPGKVVLASSGNGTAPHLAGELFKMMVGVDMTHVPYRSEGPALTDLLSGQVHVMFANPPASIEHIRAGRLRALAVTTATPTAALPHVPALANSVPSYEVTSWLGAGAPRNTPSEIIERLNKEFNATLTDPKMLERIAGFGTAPLVLSPDELAAFIVAETKKWSEVAKFAAVKVQ